LMGASPGGEPEMRTVDVPTARFHADRLYLCYPDAITPSIDLHPFLIGARCPADGGFQVFALGAGESGLEYFSPACGHTLRPPSARSDVSRVINIVTWRTWQGRVVMAGLVLGLGVLAFLLWPGPPKYPTDGWGPVWSSDGKQILFASSRDGKSQIYRMNAD